MLSLEVEFGPLYHADILARGRPKFKVALGLSARRKRLSRGRTLADPFQRHALYVKHSRRILV